MALSEAQIRKLEQVLAPQKDMAPEIKIPSTAALCTLGDHLILKDELKKLNGVSKILLLKRADKVTQNLMDMLAIVSEKNPETRDLMQECLGSLASGQSPSK